MSYLVSEQQENTLSQKSKEVFALASLVAGIFLSLVFYVPQVRTGFLGAFFLRFFKGLIGPTAFVLPLFFFWIALDFLLEKRNIIRKTRIYTLLLALVVLSAFMQALTIDYEVLKRASSQLELVSMEKASATHFLSMLWENSYESVGRYNFQNVLLGGVLGGTLASALATLFGQGGSLLILAAMLLGLLLFCFNLSFSKLFQQFWKQGQQLGQGIPYWIGKWRERKEEKAFLEEHKTRERETEPITISSYAEMSSNAAFTDQENETKSIFSSWANQAFDESQEKGSMQTAEKILTFEEKNLIEEQEKKYQEAEENFEKFETVERKPLFQMVDVGEKFLKWSAEKRTLFQNSIDKTKPEILKEESEETKQAEKTPFAVPQTLKPSRMIHPVPIGKVLSTDPAWERGDPLLEDLQVKRIFQEGPVSNLENLSQSEASLWNPSVLPTGESYGVKKGSMSNLHLASQSDLFYAKKESPLLEKESSVSSTQEKQDFFVPEEVEAYYNNQAYAYEAQSEALEKQAEETSFTDELPEFSEDFLQGKFLKNQSMLEVEPLPFLETSSTTEDLKNEPFLEDEKKLSYADLSEKQEDKAYSVEQGNYGSRLQFSPEEKNAHWVSVEEKEKPLQNLKEDFQTQTQKVFRSVEQTLLDKGILQEKAYRFPPLTLLQEERANLKVDDLLLKEQAEHLEETLNSFGVKAKVINVTTGPSITRFEVAPGVGVKVSKIVGLADDIALALAAVSVRIEAPIPGKSAVGIEIPNKETLPVSLRALLESDKFKKAESALTVALGRDIAGEPLLCDLAKMPHLLIAGATGSGKSVCINSILISLLYKASPDEVKLLLIDPKVVELKIYNDIPHLIAPVVTDPKKAANALHWAVTEMTRRYTLFAEKAVRDVKAYNQQAKSKEEKMPLILLIIDELADLMVTAANEVEDSISRLTAMARAAGIHLIIATQRPSVDVLTGVIKANIPSRIAFSVSSQIDSRTILDGAGAEKLLGKGDMLYAPQTSPKSQRAQGAFVSDREVEEITQFVKEQKLYAYNPEIEEAILNAESRVKAEQNASNETDGDMVFVPEAIELILETGQASTSILQRRLKLGYPRASRIIDFLESKGYVGPNLGSRPRRLLLTRERWEQMKKEGVDF